MSRLVILAALLLAGCVPYSSVDPARATVKGDIAIEPGARWSRVNASIGDGWDFVLGSAVESWTIDGEKLECVTFHVAVEDGDPVMKIPGAKDKTLPRFRRDMTPSEIATLVEGALARSLGAPLAPGRNLRPASLGGLPGFRFELSFTPRDEVDRELTAIGAMKDGKLYLVSYQGTRLYHYGRYLPEFERMLETLRFVGAGGGPLD
jgi:hypothetical protein